MVGSEFILQKLKDVQCNPTVLRLEIEDLLTGGDRHQCLMPIVRALVLLDNREWEYIRYVDGFPLEGFFDWQEKKRCDEREYENAGDNLSLTAREVLSWRATIEVRAGTHVQDIIGVFKCIKADQAVTHVSFYGSFGLKGTAEDLVNLIDWSSPSGGLLTNPIFVTLHCGWSTNHQESKPPHVALMTSCIYLLEHPCTVVDQLPNDQKPVRSTRGLFSGSVSSRSLSSQQSRSKSVRVPRKRRIFSRADDNDENSQGRGHHQHSSQSPAFHKSNTAVELGSMSRRAARAALVAQSAPSIVDAWIDHVKPGMIPTKVAARPTRIKKLDDVENEASSTSFPTSIERRPRMRYARRMQMQQTPSTSQNDPFRHIDDDDDNDDQKIPASDTYVPSGSISTPKQTGRSKSDGPSGLRELRVATKSHSMRNLQSPSLGGAKDDSIQKSPKSVASCGSISTRKATKPRRKSDGALNIAWQVDKMTTAATEPCGWYEVAAFDVCSDVHTAELPSETRFWYDLVAYAESSASSGLDLCDDDSSSVSSTSSVSTITAASFGVTTLNSSKKESIQTATTASTSISVRDLDVNSLVGKGRRIHSLNDLMALREALDAVISESRYLEKGGPDYDWASGSYLSLDGSGCQKTSGSKSTGSGSVSRAA